MTIRKETKETSTQGSQIKQRKSDFFFVNIPRIVRIILTFIHSFQFENALQMKKSFILFFGSRNIIFFVDFDDEY